MRPPRPSPLLLALTLLATGCAGGTQHEREVVLYTSQDSTYLERFFADFEEESGIRVRILGDTEANKTVGLAQRLRTEAKHPAADVFWNNEFANTLLLAAAGLFEPYLSPAAADIPAAFRDPDGAWTGFGARLRVVIVNSDRLGDRRAPRTWEEFADPSWKDEGVMARPLAGTTLTHVAALYAERGPEAAEALLRNLKGIALADGNAQVKNLVARGDYTWGLTDTDDLHLALLDGRPVHAVFPPAGTALVIPNTVALVKGGPNPAAARLLIDHILSTAVEERLARGPSAQFPVRSGLAGPAAFPPLAELTGTAGVPDFAAVGAAIDQAVPFLRSEFVR